MQRIRALHPWRQDPHHFKYVKVSALALLKMVMHACSGGRLEVMGILQGRVTANTFIIMDSFALPVEGTETRVNAGDQANAYMAQYHEMSHSLGRPEDVVGWYHSHPGYGCWMSGIDVRTQTLNQMLDPYLAIVVDPVRTISSGRVEIGAFRCYPEGYKPPEFVQEYQSVPTHKMEDFGAHADRYYKLETTFFKSSTDNRMLDLLWNKYWVNTLSSSPLMANRDYFSQQVEDVAAKLDGIDLQARFTSKREYNPFKDVKKDGSKSAMEHLSGLMNQVMKHSLFNFAS
eukprot:GAFH01002973.1.p2 GENE.GAFH01002973.1~~GAFH01002973.1.p2  ORF type:complete len:320 (-),score=65.46 GAFH01002973.1:75-935(-)